MVSIKSFHFLVQNRVNARSVHHAYTVLYQYHWSLASFMTYQPVIKNRNDLSRLKGEFIVFHCLKVIQGSDFLHLNLKNVIHVYSVHQN